MRTPARRLVALVVLVLIVISEPPFSPTAPMVLEAQWDVPHSHQRQAVTACLAERRHGEAILASMGSLAHYMQELSGAGFQIADFVHEGNGEIWVSALKDPARYVGWILTEEQAEGGDELAKRAAEHPAFVSAFTRVCSGGGVALYRINSGLPIAAESWAARRPAELPDARPMRASDSSLRSGTAPVPVCKAAQIDPVAEKTIRQIGPFSLLVPHFPAQENIAGHAELHAAECTGPKFVPLLL